MFYLNILYNIYIIKVYILGAVADNFFLSSEFAVQLNVPAALLLFFLNCKYLKPLNYMRYSF